MKTYTDTTWQAMYNKHFAEEVAKVNRRGGRHLVNKFLDIAPCWYEQFKAYLERQGFEVSRYQGMMSIEW